MKKNLLRDMYPDEADLIRTFWYPETPDTNDSNGFKVTLAYVNQSKLSEYGQEALTRIKQDGKVIESLPGAEQRRLVTLQLIILGVKKIEGMTYGKLRRLVPLSAEKVKALGGIDAPVDMDCERSKDAADNVAYLLEINPTFAEWVQRVISDVSRFQDSDWEQRAKNSESGADTTSVA